MLILQSAASWCRQNSAPVEELSCSYLPSRKSREDLINDYGRNYPSMSEESTDFENSVNVAAERYDRVDETDNIIDARDLRRRFAQRNSPASNSAYGSSESRRLVIN